MQHPASNNHPSNMKDSEFRERLRFYGLSFQEATQHALVGAYLNIALNTGDGARFSPMREESPWDRQGRHPDGTPTEEAFTDTEFVRAALERANPWLAWGE